MHQKKLVDIWPSIRRLNTVCIVSITQVLNLAWSDAAISASHSKSNMLQNILNFTIAIAWVLIVPCSFFWDQNEDYAGTDLVSRSNFEFY